MSAQPRGRGPWWKSEDRKALVLMFVSTSVLFGAVMAIVSLFWGPRQPLALAAIVILGAFSGVVFGGLMTEFVYRLQASNGGAKTSRLMQKAYKTQIIPDSVDRAEWASLVERHERSAREQRFYLPIFFALVLAFHISHISNTTGPDNFITWIGVVLFGLALIYTPFDTERRIRRIKQLRSQLDAPSSLVPDSRFDENI
jgi:hypothetical protein